MIQRIISLLLAIIIYLLAIFTREWTTWIYLWMYLAIAVVSIWYGDDIVVSKAVVTSGEHSGAIVRFVGWCLLILPLLIYLYQELISE